jgi:hypothetical protein
MQTELRDELGKTKDESKLVELMQQFIALKKTEQEILQRPGTVIVNSASR